MSWTNLTVQTNKKEVDIVSDFLLELGAISTSIENTNLNQNNEELIFSDPNNQSQKFWEKNTLQALFKKKDNIELIKMALKNKFNNINFSFKTFNVYDQDWVKLTQSQFKPIKIHRKLWIIPTWHEIQDKKAINLILDPGLAFGTGTHPTTHLSLLWLLNNVKENKTVLDYGCGSGILGIAAKKLGAEKVLAVDIDEQAIEASKKNAAENKVKIFLSNAKNKVEFKADLIVANILSSALIVLAPALSKHCNTGGQIALSGILQSQEQSIKKIYSKWFDFNPTLIKDGWILISGTRR